MNIAIVEVSESHEECIYTQVAFLKDAGYTVSLYIHPKIEPQIVAYRHLIDKIKIIDFDSANFFQRMVAQSKLFRAINKYDRVIFNTASSSKTVRNLCILLSFSKVQCLGVLHNTKKLKGSFTQNTISLKIKKYFVLNDFLKTDEKPKKIKLESFYPIFFPKTSPDNSIEKKHIWITIPGRLDYDRRNYDFLFKAISENENLDNIKFLFLGKIDKNSLQGKRFYSSITKYNIARHLILFNSFIENNSFYNYLNKSDYILPLLQLNNDYLKHKITGTFNLAFAYKKQLICNDYFSEIEDLHENSFFYTNKNFNTLISDINTNTIIQKTSYKNTKWDYEVQKTQYLRFINS